MSNDATLEKITKHLEHLSNQNTIIIAIDGRCASGKTTYAAKLADIVDANIFHMDDFFLQSHQRTRDRFISPGENVDHERFLSEVLAPLRKGLPVAYRRFDCHTMELLSPTTVSPKRINIVEGSYSCHKQLFDYYDYRIFMTTNPEQQLDRISKRNGSAAVIMFRDKWIPMEEAYFKEYNIEGRSNLIVTT